MAEQYPLIRIPTQPARMTLFAVLPLAGIVFGIIGGLSLGHRYFGVMGVIVGAISGAVVGIVVGSLPGYFMQEQLFREMQRSSNEELKAKLEHPMWSFYQTLALVNLQVRGDDVQPYLGRVLGLLESGDQVTRSFGRDALRLVFTPLAKQLDDLGYDPNVKVEECRTKVAKLRESLAVKQAGN